MVGWKTRRLVPSARAAVWLALVLMAAALLLNTASIYLIIKDHEMVGRWLPLPVAAPRSVIATLQREYDLRIASRLVISAILIIGAMVILAIERKLRRMRLVAAEVFARMERGVITVDRRGTITVINPAAARFLMLDGDHVGKPLSGISSADVPLVAMVEEAASEPAIRERDFVLQRGGRTQRIRADSHVLEDAAGTRLGCVIMLRDVTQRYLEEQRLQRIERLQNLGLLAAGLIHEIGNPLTALGIHVRLLEERLEACGAMASAAELIEVLESEIERLDGVLVEFRDYADLQTLAMRPTDVVSILERVSRLIRPQATRQSVRVELRKPVPPLPLVTLDADKFAQSVLNLAVNALEAMPSGGEMTVGAERHDGSVAVRVSDTGPGIAAEVRENLFKPYVTTKPQGTGLGLALTEKLVILQRGQIDYHTGPGGTSFVLTFPLASSEDRSP
jgi:PAS domain S-box-containing protein